MDEMIFTDAELLETLGAIDAQAGGSEKLVDASEFSKWQIRALEGKLWLVVMPGSDGRLWARVSGKGRGV